METRSADHPSSNVLRALAAGQLDDATTEAVLAHLEGCFECSRGLNTVPPPPLVLPPPPAPPADVLPELRNHPDYEVLRELDRGGMGVVYLARHRLTQRLEVLKVVNPHLLATQPGLAERFLREIRLAARLDHKNIVKVYTALQIGPLVVAVMEYVEGENLARVVKERGPLPLVNACYYAQQAAAGLQHAFEKGMVHRDIKPGNLRLARDGEEHIVKVLDFGLAKVRREGEGTGHELTGTGQVLGTPEYMAPEQSEDAAGADIRADIYSLGCTLYCLLTGGPPFKAKSTFGLLQAHASQTATPLNEVRPEVPAELAAVIAKMMAKGPAQRYQAPAEVVRALALFVKTGLRPLAGVSPAEGAPDRPDTMGPAVARPVAIPVAKAADQTAPPTAPRQAPARKEPKPGAGGPRKWRGVLAAGGVALLLAVAIGLWASGALRDKRGDDSFRPETGAERPSQGAGGRGGGGDDPKPAQGDIVTRVKQVAGIDLVPIPAGEFLMGSPKGDEDAFDDETPQHKVRITKPFYLGKTKVTVGQFRRFVDVTGHTTEAEKAGDKYTWKKPGHNDRSFEQTDEHPVVCVSWNDAKAYCDWLDGRLNGQGKVRLPSEAEWEYSCRAQTTAGPTTKYYFGDNDADLGDYAWYTSNTNDTGTRPCGQKKPNAFDLYDMHGLAWEWCADVKRKYEDHDETDPVGPTAAGASRVVRGGSWYFDPRRCRAAFRSVLAPSYRSDRIGFRVLVVR
jgi:formylglycine-generating enzyme required for sulfatase activity